MELYLIRHGETDYNKERKIQGSCDIPLNEYGRELAKVTAEGLKDIPFDVIFTSPLCRARETAEWIARGRQIPVYEDKRLKEICFGEYEGLCCGRWDIIFPMEVFFLIPSSLIRKIIRHHPEAKALRM